MNRRDRENIIVSFWGIMLVLGASMLFAAALVFLLSREPLRAVRYFFTGPFVNRYFFGNMLDASVPLIFTGLGIALAFKASLFNLGGEGQIYLGALVTTIVCTALPEFSGTAGGIAALCAGGVAAGLLASLSGYLKVQWNVDSMISSFLVSSAVIYGVNFFITGVFKDPSSSLLATRSIDSRYFLPRLLLPSTLSTSIFFALGAALLVYFLLYRTRWGYEMTMCGLNPEFARYGGVHVSSYVTMPFFLSGLLHGLGGGFAVLGTYHMSIKGFTSGLGWGGIAVALIAKNNPLGVIPAALFFAYLNAGSKAAMLYTDVTFEVAAVVEAFIFFFITSDLLFTFVRRKRRTFS